MRHTHKSVPRGLESGQLSLGDELALESPFTHEEKCSRSLRWEEEKKGIWTSRLMLTGISARSEEGVVWWCVCCHRADSHAWSNEHWLEGSRAKSTELPNNLLSRFTDNIKWGDLLFKRLRSCCKIIQAWEIWLSVYKVECWWCLIIEHEKLIKDLSLNNRIFFYQL